MLGLFNGFFRPYFNKEQRYAVSIAVHDVPKGATLLLPFPIHTIHQAVSHLEVQTDGKAIQHDGFALVEGANHATVNAVVETEPLHIPPMSGNLRNQQLFTDHYYLESDAFVYTDSPAIQAKAKELNQGEDTYVLLEKLYQHTLERLSYGNAYAGLYTTEQALSLPLVDCGGFSTYLAALARACGIPSRIVSGFWAGDGKNHMHAWVECLLPNNEWLPIDASVAWLRLNGRSRKRGGFGDIGSDRIVTSLGSHHIIRLHGKEIPIGIRQVPLWLDANGHSTFSTTHYITANRIR